MYVQLYSTFFYRILSILCHVAREPRLPIDALLGVEHDSGKDGSSDWLAIHHERLRDAWETVGKRLYAEADKRREQAASPNAPRLESGCKVFVRNRSQGRAKIQDAWKSDPYVVKEYLGEGVYLVESLADGTFKTLNRVNLNFCPNQGKGKPDQCEPSLSRSHPVDDNKQDQDSKDENSSDSESGSQVIVHVSSKPKGPEESMVHEEGRESDSSDSDSEGVASPPDALPPKFRKSTRKSAGRHANPYNQPRSVLGNDIIADFFLKLTSTITDSFGQTLVKALESIKSQGYYDICNNRKLMTSLLIWLSWSLRTTSV